MNTKKDFICAAKMERQHLYLLEKGLHRPGFNTLERMAEALHCHPFDLLLYTEDSPNERQ